MIADDMTCKELVELVTEYFEGTLPAPDRERFEAHLVDCEGCQTYVQQMQQTIRALGMLTEESISAAAKDRLLRAFRTWKTERP